MPRAIAGADIKPSSPAPTSALKIWFSFILVFTSVWIAKPLHSGPSVTAEQGSANLSGQRLNLVV